MHDAHGTDMATSFAHACSSGAATCTDWGSWTLFVLRRNRGFQRFDSSRLADEIVIRFLPDPVLTRLPASSSFEAKLPALAQLLGGPIVVLVGLRPLESWRHTS